MMDDDEAEYLRRWHDEKAAEYDNLVWGDGLGEPTPKQKKDKNKKKIKPGKEPSSAIGSPNGVS